MSPVVNDQSVWFVGASYNSTNDQTQRFLSEGIWDTGFDDEKIHEQVKLMKVGERIAIKSTYVKKHGLPFDNKNEFVSVMAIKAIGTITENPNDGRQLKVSWTKVLPFREWYFFTSRRTIWRVSPGEWSKDALIEFTFENATQDFERFLQDPYWHDRYSKPDLKSRFAWTKFYEVVGEKLLAYKQDRKPLIEGIHEICKAHGIDYLKDEYNDGTSGPLKDICPFTAMGIFNRSMTDANRTAIAKDFATFLEIDIPTPNSFAGIPLLNNQRSMFFHYSTSRAEGDIDTNWEVFEAANQFIESDEAEARNRFMVAYDNALNVKGVKWNLTTGLYWIHPWEFPTLDTQSRNYISKKLKLSAQSNDKNEPLSSTEYLNLIDELEAGFKDDNYPVHSFPELSFTAYETTETIENKFWIEKCDVNVKGRADRLDGENALGLALWSPQKDKAGKDIYSNMRKVKEGDIIFHFADKKAIIGISVVAKPADHDFICLAGTAWGGLPGYRVELKDYIKLEKEITRNAIFEHRDLLQNLLIENKGLFYSKKLELNQGQYLTKAPEALVQLFAKIYTEISGKPLPHYIPDDNDVNTYTGVKVQNHESYTISDIVNDGCFLNKPDIENLLDRLNAKKNLILQGPPGTGKTWLARRLAFALIGSKNDANVRAVQFHPNLSYEDFVRGWRPSGDGKLTLSNGVFMEAINAAIKNPQSKFIVVIEEINRGNPAQIFGELLTLLEESKRHPSEALELCYPDADGIRRPVYIPENLYVIGTMNIADRSLALVDLALRRRFAFINLEPKFGPTWQNWVVDKCNLEKNLALDIEQRLIALNDQIAKDPRLGKQFQIGHSYVTPSKPLATGGTRKWFDLVIQTEIGPLLEEYWFDAPEEAKKAIDRLMQGW